MKFDHDFIGRDALEKIEPEAQRKKVTLAWDAEDMEKIFGSLFDVEGGSYQWFDLPIANYGSSNFDSVVDADGTVVGYSMFSGYSANEKRAVAGHRRPQRGDRHRGPRRLGLSPAAAAARRPSTTAPSRSTCAPSSPQVPYAVTARAAYAEGWRTAHTV